MMFVHLCQEGVCERWMNQIIMSKYEAVMVEQQFDDCLLCRALADTNDILFF